MSSSSASLPFRAFKEISSESRSVTALAFSPSGEYIAYGSEEGIVAIHELQTSKSYDGKVCSRVTGLKWVPNRQEPALIISERNGHLHVLARVAGQFKETVNVMGFIAPVTALDIYTNPPYICLAVGNGDVVDLVTLNIHTLKEEASFRLTNKRNTSEHQVITTALKFIRPDEVGVTVDLMIASLEHGIRYAVVDTKELSASYNLDIKLRVPMSGSADVIERKQVLMVVNNLCDGLDIYYLNPGSRRSVESGVKHIALAVPPDANYAYPVRFVQKGKCMAVGFANGRTLILEIGNPDPVQVLTQSDAGTGNVLTMDYWSNGQIEMLATATIGPQRAKLMIWSSQKVSKNIQVVNVEQNQGRTKRAAVSKHDRTPATIAYEIIWKSLALFLCLLTMLLAFDVDPFGVIPMFLSSVNAIGWRKATPVKDLDWSLDLEGTHWEDLSQTISVDSLYIPIATEQLPDQAEEVSSSQMEFLLTGDTTSLVAGLPTGTETVTVTITTLTVTNYDLGPVLSGLNIHLEKLISIIDDRIPKMTTESSKTPTTDSGMGRLDFWMNSIIPSRPLFIVVTAAFGGVAIVYWKMQKDGKDQGTNMRERDIGTALDKAGDAQIGKEGKKEFVWDVTEDEIGENRGMVNQAESAASAEAQFSSLTDVSNESILGKREADSGEAGAQD